MVCFPGRMSLLRLRWGWCGLVVQISIFNPKLINIKTCMLLTTASIPIKFCSDKHHQMLLVITYTSRLSTLLLPFSEPPPLCQRHSTLLLLSPTQLQHRYYSHTKCSSQSSSWMTANFSSLSQSSIITFVNFVCTRPYLNSTTAYTIATSIIHSKHEYCNCLYCNLPNLPKCQITYLQQMWNSVSSAVVKARKFCHTTLILHSLCWLKINEHVEYKLLSFTYKVLITSISAQPRLSSVCSQHSLFSCCHCSSSILHHRYK